MESQNAANVENLDYLGDVSIPADIAERHPEAFCIKPDLLAIGGGDVLRGCYALCDLSIEPVAGDLCIVAHGEKYTLARPVNPEANGDIVAKVVWIQPSYPLPALRVEAI